MDIRSIRSDDDLTEALAEIERLWNAEPGTDDFRKLDVLTDLVEHYENKHFSLGANVDGVEMLEAHMEATDATQADLGRVIGSRSHASEIMNRKRALSIDMIRAISQEWKLPAETLMRKKEPA